MTSGEILKEYQRDYQAYLRPKFSSLASRNTHTLKKSRGKWVCLREEVTTKTPTGNIYGSKVRLKWDKKSGAGWSSVTYLSTSDSRTGKKVAYLFSDDLPILLSSSFLRELRIPLPEFLGHGCTWTIMSGESEGERYSSYIDFGEDIGAGVGGWENGVLVLRHLVLDWKEDPVSEFLEARQKEEDVSQKSEIDLAWEAYLRGELEEESLIHET